MALGRLGLLKQSVSPVAIDFGVSALKVLQVVPGQPPALVSAAAIDTPDDLLYDHVKRLDFQLEALPRLIKSGGFRGKRAVCAIPSYQSFYCKHLEFQKAEGVPIMALIRAELPRQLGCDPDALVYRHIEVGAVERPGGANKTEVICMATARSLVQRLMGAIKTSRLEPVGMHSEFEAVLCCMIQGQDVSEESTLYIDIGYATTKVLIAHGQKLTFARVIELAGRHLDETIGHQLKLTHTQARNQRLAMRELPRAATPVPSQTVAAALGVEEPARPHATKTVRPEIDLTEPLEILTDEISMCIRYYNSLFPSRRLKNVVFVGGESRHRAMCEHVARVLRLPAQQADPMARIARTGKEPSVGVDFNEPQPAWAVALGLCLSPTDL